MEERLQQLLLRADIIVEEAEERLVTNQAMLQQLNILRKETHRGHYTLDSLRCHSHEEDNRKDHEVSNYFTPSKFNPAKRVRFCGASGQSLQEQLQQILASLKLILEDMREFVMFLNSYPRLCRQPYSMHLLLDKCLFSRQMEMEHIMNFLLKEDTTGAESLGVLPIVGPARVGKSTLIEHACEDERVRNLFSQIVRFSDDDLKDARMVTLRDCGAIKHQNHATGGGRVLIIIDLTKDVDEGAWRRLYSVSKSCVASGSKIIVASRSDKIVNLGTTQALRVQFLTEEAYWYFFKVRTFGSMDAQDHPELASIAMDLAREMTGCFIGSSIYSVLLKANFNARFWRMALGRVREFRHKNPLLLRSHFYGTFWVDKPAYVRRLSKISSDYLVILDQYQTGSVKNVRHGHRSSAQIEAEVVSMEDFLFGHVPTRGKFKVLAWRSYLPPYYNDMLDCEVRRSHPMVARKKRLQKLAT